jgi:N-acetylmuramoyl-L-alanine amidase
MVAFCILLLSVTIRNRQEGIPTLYASSLPGLPVIVVDAGHGGIDGGASGADGTVEKDINLSIAKKLETILTSCGFQVIMTRREDDLISDPSLNTIRQRKQQDIFKRLKIAENNPKNVLVSIHQNHYSQSRYKGTQVFYSKNHPDSQLLADALQQQIVALLQPDNTRKVKVVGSEIYLLNNCKNPSVMVECGFLSNPKDLSLLTNENYQSQMAFAIAVGLLKFYT